MVLRKGLSSERLGHKLLVIYLLTFVLPTAYLLVCIFQFSAASGLTHSVPAELKLGLLFGVPAVVAMSVAAFLLLRQSVRCLRLSIGDAAAFLEGFEPVATTHIGIEDEACRLSHYVSCMIEAVQSRIAALDRQAMELHAEKEKLTRLATADPLTGLYNRKHVMRLLDTEVQRATRRDAALSALLLEFADLDLIKETYGEAKAQEIIREIGLLIDAGTRRVDPVARIAETQFLVLLLETDAKAAEFIGARLRKTLTERAFPLGDADPFHLSVCVGMSELSDGATDAEKLVQAAEASLLIARRDAAQ